MILGVALTTNLFAQQPANPPASAATTNAAQTFPPPTPASPATLAKISRMSPLFNGRTLDGWKASVKGTNAADITKAWTIKDGAMASLGEGRGVLHTTQEYGNYRLIFTMRHVGGPPSDHRACVLIYCTAPAEGQPTLDALGGIQFQPPNGGSWDYRPGKNNSGKGLFTRLAHPKYDEHEWFQVELLVNAETGTARMAVAQPVGTKAYEVLDFKDPTAGKKGPIAWQMHNKGLFDEYKDVRIEENPMEEGLITVE